MSTPPLSFVELARRWPGSIERFDHDCCRLHACADLEFREHKRKLCASGRLPGKRGRTRVYWHGHVGVWVRASYSWSTRPRSNKANAVMRWFAGDAVDRPRPRRRRWEVTNPALITTYPDGLTVVTQGCARLSPAQLAALGSGGLDVGRVYYALPDGSITADPSASAVQVGIALRSDTMLVTGPAGVVL